MGTSVLVISDDPERRNFRQILILRRLIERASSAHVDILAISGNKILLNQKCIGSGLKQEGIDVITGVVLRKRNYQVFVVSVNLQNLTRLFHPGEDTLDLINRTSPKAAVFVFGAASVLDRVTDRRHELSVFVYSRSGVSKYTQEFRNAVLSFVRGIQERATQELR